MSRSARADADTICAELVELVTAYLEGAMAPADVARVDAHLALCDGCAAYVDQMRTTIRLTGRITAADMSPELRRALADVFRRWQSERV